MQKKLEAFEKQANGLELNDDEKETLKSYTGEDYPTRDECKQVVEVLKFVGKEWLVIDPTDEVAE